MLKREESRRQYRHYSGELKRAVLREVDSGADSLRYVAHKYDVNDSTVRYWLSIREKIEGKCVPLQLEPSFGANHSPEDENIMARNEDALSRMNDEELRQEVIRLQKALEMAELRAEALDIMINIAERQEGIRIRKKSGAKQS